ncbi:MAG: 16S rRNA (cytidine(1402)-2'-O)-methyltransferase [Pseudomonadota bacterium]
MIEGQYSVSASPQAAIDSLVAPISEQLAVLHARGLEPGLYVVPTPIGNLSDITIRALHMLTAVHTIFAEDTRHSARLLQHYRISTRVRPYHDHSSEAQRSGVVEKIASGHAVALISDAGTPLISDPGFKLARDVLDAGFPVVSLPGPSAVLPALTSSGLPTDAFCFLGFLPNKSAARRKRVEVFREFDATLVFYEAPGRMASSLQDLAEVLGPREACVVRELTKQYEEVVRAPLPELAQIFDDRDVRGECVIVVGPPSELATVTDDMISERLLDVLSDHSVRDATRLVMDELRLPRNRVYRLALALSRAS